MEEAKRLKVRIRSLTTILMGELKDKKEVADELRKDIDKLNA